MLYSLLAGGGKIQGEKYTFKGGDLRRRGDCGGICLRSYIQHYA